MIFSFSESIGYLASFIVLVSFLMKNIKTLRLVNIAGCLLFVFYGILLSYSWPIIITNVSIVIINLFYLLKSNRKNIV
jgi:uncharacterized protein with PQ loop repeat